MIGANQTIAALALCIAAATPVQAQAPNQSLLKSRESANQTLTSLDGERAEPVQSPGSEGSSNRVASTVRTRSSSGDGLKSNHVHNELPRRIIVAPSANGRSHVAREDVIPQSEGTGIRLTNLWLAPATPIAKPRSQIEGFIPFTMQQMREPLYAVTLVEYPSGTGQADPGMHATATIDHFYVIEGEIVLVLEEGEVPLRAGDVAVVQGAMHGWRNDAACSARLLFFVLPTQ